MKKLLLLSIVLPALVSAAELAHQFNSPAFSGVGYSSHVLTLKQLEDQQKEKNKALADAIKAKAEADALNTPQAKFLANLESRVYSQLAKQLTDSMFGEGQTCTSTSQCGIIPDLGGNKVTWHLSSVNNIDPVTGRAEPAGMIVIDIQNNSNATQRSIMYVPSGTFYF